MRRSGSPGCGRHQEQCRSFRLPARCPPRFERSLASGCSSKKPGFPRHWLDRIKRLAAFQNPEFYKKQSLRLSTALTPRVIACAEDLPAHIGLPRGCRADLDALLKEHGISLEVDDQRVGGQPLALQFTGTLTPIQERAAGAILSHDMGSSSHRRVPVNRRGQLSRRGASLQHAHPRSSAAACGSVAHAARAVSRTRSTRDRPVRRGQAEREWTPRPRDDPKSGASGNSQ